MKRWLTSLLLASGLACAQDNPPELPPETPPPATTSLPEAAMTSQPAPVPVGTEKAIPQAYSEEHYASTWSRNPFLIETRGPDKAPGPGFADDWELRGLTRSKGQPEAFLSNKKTQEFRWVKTVEDKDGFKLIKANIDRDLHKSSVEVTKAGESSPATFTFPEVAAAPGGTNRGAPAIPQPNQMAPNGGVNRVGTFPGAPTAAMRPGTNVPGGAMPQAVPGGNVPHNAPGMKSNGANPIPSQPTAPGRRRVLIPPQPPQPGSN